MTIFIKDPATDKAVRKLAKLKKLTLTDAIGQAVANELERATKLVPLTDRIAAITARFSNLPKSGLKADKAFYDELSGDT